MTTWTFDNAHSSVGFIVRHMMVSKVHGRFNEWTGTLKADPVNLSDAKLNVSIQTASIDTGMAKRDEHLRSADFFDADTNPAITFTSKAVETSDNHNLKVTGELTMNGVTQLVTMDVEMVGPAQDPWGNQRMGFSAVATLNRTDFGLTWNQALETGGVLVSEEVKLEIEVQAVEAQQEQEKAA